MEQEGLEEKRLTKELEEMRMEEERKAEEKRKAERRAEERRKQEEEEERATKEFAQKGAEALKRQLDEAKRKKELKRSRAESEMGRGVDRRVHYVGRPNHVEDEGRTLRGVPEEGTKMPLAGGVFVHQGLPLVQRLEG